MDTIFDFINQVLNLFGIDVFTMLLNSVAEAAFSLWNTVLEKIVTVVSQTPSAWSPGAYQKVVQIASQLIGFAEGLLVLVFAIGVFGTTSSFTEHKSWSASLRLFVRFILAKTGIECIANNPIQGSSSGSILKTIDTMVYGVVDIVIGGTGSVANHTGNLFVDGGLPENILAELKGELSMWQMIFYMILILLLLLVMAVMAIRLFVIVYGRFFKIYILTAISPIPMAFYGSQSTQRVGIGFIKSYVIALAEVIIIILAFVVYNLFITEVNVYGGDSFIMYLFNAALSVTLLVSLIQGADRTLREIAGG